MRQEITGADACVMMHTALRKCCDSKITSCVYNLVHIVDIKPEKFDPWRFYGQLVADLVNARIPPKDAVKTAHERLRDRFSDVVHGVRPYEVPRTATTWMLALDCALHCFDESDWKGMSAYLEDSR